MPGINPYEYYLSRLSKWETAPVLSNLWYLEFNFEPLKSLINDLPGKLNAAQYGNKDWKIPQNNLDIIINPSNQKADNGLNGCFFARQVELPSETVNSSKDGLKYSGFTAPVITSEKAQPLKFAATFLETNVSFATLIIRPWLILSSHYGRIARPDSSKNIKCSVIVCELAKSNEYGSPLKVRQKWGFEGVSPVTSDGYNLAQEDGFINRRVEFAFDSYTVESLVDIAK